MRLHKQQCKELTENLKNIEIQEPNSNVLPAKDSDISWLHRLPITLLMSLTNVPLRC